jgi:hypothetical protein
MDFLDDRSAACVAAGLLRRNRRDSRKEHGSTREPDIDGRKNGSRAGSSQSLAVDAIGGAAARTAHECLDHPRCRYDRQLACKETS